MRIPTFINWCYFGWHCWHADFDRGSRTVRGWFKYHKSQRLFVCCTCKKEKWFLW